MPVRLSHCLLLGNFSQACVHHVLFSVDCRAACAFAWLSLSIVTQQMQKAEGRDVCKEKGERGRGVGHGIQAFHCVAAECCASYPSVSGDVGAGSRTEQRAAARKEGQQRSGSPFGSTAARYMNPRAAAKPTTEPDRMFRARSVPRGMSPQRSRVADYIRVGSPVQRVSSTQVQPCCNAKFISASKPICMHDAHNGAHQMRQV